MRKGTLRFQKMRYWRSEPTSHLVLRIPLFPNGGVRFRKERYVSAQDTRVESLGRSILHRNAAFNLHFKCDLLRSQAKWKHSVPFLSASYARQIVSFALQSPHQSLSSRAEGENRWEVYVDFCRRRFRVCRMQQGFSSRQTFEGTHYRVTSL